jgi:hypothetical protein
MADILTRISVFLRALVLLKNLISVLSAHPHKDGLLFTLRMTLQYAHDTMMIC